MEKDIATFANFTLKSGRITQSGARDSSSSFTSIPLRAYSSSTTTKSSRPFYILLALASLIGSVYIYTDGSFSMEQIRYEWMAGIYNENINEFYNIKLSQNNYQRLTIQTGLWLAFRGIEKNNIYLPWAELGKKPVRYYTDKEPSDQKRINQLCKPHKTLRAKFFISLVH